MLCWRKILCPVDFSETSRRALDVAADLAGQQRAELMLLHVYQAPGVNFPEATIYPGDDILQELEELALKGLARSRLEAERHGALKVATYASMGTPYAEIVRFAEEQRCDLIVMGTHGRTALLRVLMGSVAEKVVRHAPCPVLTVRPPRRGPEEPKAVPVEGPAPVAP